MRDCDIKSSEKRILFAGDNGVDDINPLWTEFFFSSFFGT